MVPSHVPRPTLHAPPVSDWLRCVGRGLQGEKLPADVKLNFFDGEGNMQEISVGELTKGKKVRGW